MKKKIIFINSHPIQYFAPMYKYMNENGVETNCWYCSDPIQREEFDQEFNVKIKWDIPLLEGYEYRFFKNNSWKHSHFEGFLKFINLDMFKELMRIPKSVIVVHGWHYFTLFFILMMAKSFGHTVCLRCELPQNQEILKNTWIQKIKLVGLKRILFPRINHFLYIGQQNYKFYKSLEIPDEKLLSCPYSVDNNRFRNEYKILSDKKNEIKRKLGIPESDQIIIFSAKYIPKKRPLDILAAFAKIYHPNLWLIMVGEGEMRAEMESMIKIHTIHNVILTGFVNQSSISEYYTIGDLFVMCSGIGETWGLSVNEAMNFNLPLILSDLSGCAVDLVKPGVNGFTFKTGDIDDLGLKLKRVLFEGGLTKAISSSEIVKNYSYETITDNMTALV